jgi:hypothetical protein
LGLSLSLLVWWCGTMSVCNWSSNGPVVSPIVQGFSKFHLAYHYMLINTFSVTPIIYVFKWKMAWLNFLCNRIYWVKIYISILGFCTMPVYQWTVAGVPQFKKPCPIWYVNAYRASVGWLLKGEPCPSANLSTTNPTWTHLGAALRSRRPTPELVAPVVGLLVTVVRIGPKVRRFKPGRGR